MSNRLEAGMWLKEEPLYKEIERFVEGRDFEQARVVLRRITNDQRRWDAIRLISDALAAEGKHEEAIGELKELNSFLKTSRLIEIGSIMTNRGDDASAVLSNAFSELQRIQPDVYGIASLAAELAQAQVAAEVDATKTWKFAHDKVKEPGMSDVEVRDSCEAIINAQLASGLFSEALALAQECDSRLSHQPKTKSDPLESFTLEKIGRGYV